MSNNSGSEESDGIVICTICYERYCNSADVSACDCGHVFHHACLMQWLTEKHNCPNCRIDRPSHSKIFLDYEANNNEMRQRSATSGAGAGATDDNDSVASNNEATSNVIENLLYETGLLTEEIDYLNQRFATKNSELTKKDEELSKMHLELAKQRERNIKLESVLAEIKSSISKTDTFEGLVTEIINTIVLGGDDVGLGAVTATATATASAHDESDSDGSTVNDDAGATALPLSDPISSKSLEDFLQLGVLEVDDEVNFKGAYRCQSCGHCHPSNLT